MAAPVGGGLLVRESEDPCTSGCTDFDSLNGVACWVRIVVFVVLRSASSLASLRGRFVVPQDLALYSKDSVVLASEELQSNWESVVVPTSEELLEDPKGFVAPTLEEDP